MMPILEQTPVPPHQHGHGHQAYCHEAEQTNKIQLTLILPNGVPSMINVDANTPMMDLLVQAASINKLNPSGYSLVVFDSNQHVIHYKANQTIGQIGSSTISLLPKETTHSNLSSKTKTQPFEITVRLQINLPDAQKILLRVDPTLSLHEIKEQICQQKKYTHSNQYTFCLPNKLNQPLLLGLSLAEYKTNELTLVYNKNFKLNQHQSFDHLRRENQLLKENFHHINKNHSSTLRPSHTSLHAYWNDPNFDTQSQISNNSSIVKKRRAPRPPGYVNSNRPISQIYIQQQQITYNDHSLLPPLRLDCHRSYESLQSENIKKKRKAPVIIQTNSIQNKDEFDKIDEEQFPTNNFIRPDLDPPPPPIVNTDSTSIHEEFCSVVETGQKSIDESQQNSIDNEQQLSNLVSPIHEKLIITTHFQQPTNIENSSTEHIESEITNSMPMIVQQQDEKLEQKEISMHIQPIVETISKFSSVPKPLRQNIKKSSTTDGLLRIIDDQRHNQHRNEKQQKETNENVSYFRVAKSRYGKFETDSQGFINNSIAIFDSTNQQKFDQKVNENLHSLNTTTNLKQQKSLPTIVQHQTKGKQAYNLLKKYEKEVQLQLTNNVDYLKTTNDTEKTMTSIQLEATEQMTHTSVNVESDGKRIITETSPISKQQPSPPSVPPIIAPKPFGKTITEYRTVRRSDNIDGIMSKLHNGTTLSTDVNNKQSASSHEALMEAIRQFGGSQNLRKT